MSATCPRTSDSMVRSVVARLLDSLTAPLRTLDQPGAESSPSQFQPRRKPAIFWTAKKRTWIFIQVLVITDNFGGPPVSRTRHQRIMSLRVCHIPSYFVVYEPIQTKYLALACVVDRSLKYPKILRESNPGVTLRRNLRTK